MVVVILLWYGGIFEYPLWCLIFYGHNEAQPYNFQNLLVIEILYLLDPFGTSSYLSVDFRKQKNPHVMLFVINFPNDEGHPPNEWTFSDLMIVNYLMVREFLY